jgi:glycosyltransferase involved in cell wall biosynthesis
MARPTIDIVIPAYNEQDNLPHCLDAIAAQTTRPTRVVVVDNNSSDNTAAIARRYPFVKLVTESKQGLTYARYTGFEAATSDLIARLDAETLLAPDWVERVLAFYADSKHSETTLVGTGYFYNLKAPKFTGAMIKGHFQAAKFVLGHNAVWGPSFVIPRSVWQKIKTQICHGDDILEDIDTAIHLSDANLPIYWDDNLKGGVKIRHVETLSELWAGTRRWPITLERHGRPEWRITLVGLAIAFIPQWALIMLLKKN